MAESVFTFSCPCCGKLVEIDTRSGRARAARPEEAKGGRDLDSLLKGHAKEQERLADMFRSAKDQQASEAERLAKQLERAKHEAKKDKDERPPSIFDLD
jgi:uncharacterized Zn finger protein (UPF0148 family)